MIRIGWLLSVLFQSLVYEDGTWRAPESMDGEPCEWPMCPLLVPRDAPLGMFHCHGCGDMVIAGFPHGDAKGLDEAMAQDMAAFGWDSQNTIVPRWDDFPDL